MSKFDKCAKAAGKVARKTARGVAKLSDSAATAVKIKIEESKLKSELAELGRMSLDYFTDAESVPQSIAQAIDEIKAQKALVKKLKEEAKNKKDGLLSAFLAEK